MSDVFQLIREQILKKAAEYQQKGYRVIIEPNRDNRPEFLGDFQPDIIAYGEHESVIIEVKISPTLRPMGSQLEYISTLLQGQPGWRLELLLVNPTMLQELNPAITSVTPLDEKEIEMNFQTVKEMAGNNPESALLYLWSLAEAVLRIVSQREGVTVRQGGAGVVLRQLVAEGAIDRQQFQTLMESWQIRNTIAHGFKVDTLSSDFVLNTLNVIEQLLHPLQAAA